MLSALQSDSHRKEITTLIMLLHHILQTPTFMHHLGSTLSLRCFVRWDYEGKSEPNISCWQKYSAHTKVYIFQLKNNYSSSIPRVFACFIVLTKKGGPFIIMNGRSHWIFSVFQHIQPQSALPDLWLLDGDHLRFMIYDSLCLENKSFLHVNIFHC